MGENELSGFLFVEHTYLLKFLLLENILYTNETEIKIISPETEKQIISKHLIIYGIVQVIYFVMSFVYSLFVYSVLIRLF